MVLINIVKTIFILVLLVRYTLLFSFFSLKANAYSYYFESSALACKKISTQRRHNAKKHLFTQGLYVYLMASESIKKYFEFGLMVEIKTENSSGLTSPAVTICARFPNAS